MERPVFECVTEYSPTHWQALMSQRMIRQLQSDFRHAQSFGYVLNLLKNLIDWPLLTSLAFTS